MEPEYFSLTNPPLSNTLLAINENIINERYFNLLDKPNTFELINNFVTSISEEAEELSDYIEEAAYQKLYKYFAANRLSSGAKKPINKIQESYNRFLKFIRSTKQSIKDIVRSLKQNILLYQKVSTTSKSTFIQNNLLKITKENQQLSLLDSLVYKLATLHHFKQQYAT
jgi:hypothetical protein